jgi:uncharacterized membrane protein
MHRFSRKKEILMRTVVDVFLSREEADRVAHDLKAVGIPSDDVSIADGAGGDRREWSQRNIAACTGASYGWFIAAMIPLVADRSRPMATAIGAAIGGVAGAVAGLIALAVRGGVPLLPGSPAVTVLAGLAIGAGFGAAITELYSMGVSHEDVPLDDEAVREHGIVVAAHVDEPREPKALHVMNEHGARNLRDDDDAWVASGWKGEHGIEEPYPSDSSFRSHQPG